MFERESNQTSTRTKGPTLWGAPETVVSIITLLLQKKRWHDRDVQDYDGSSSALTQTSSSNYPPSHSTRGHRYKIFKPHAQKRIRCHCLRVRAIDDWNRLPDPIFDVKFVLTTLKRVWTNTGWESSILSLCEMTVMRTSL